MNAPKFRELRVKDIIPAAWNPPRRTADDAIRGLVDSISQIGLMYPVLVGDGNRLVEGHRRRASYMRLGLATIPAIVAKGDPASIYAEVNGTGRRTSGNDALVVYMNEPNAVNKLIRARLVAMEEVLGNKLVGQLAAGGYSIKLFNQASQLARYLDREDDSELVVKSVRWMMKHRVSSLVKQAMATGQSASTILRAIHSDRPIGVKVAVE